jgi:tetratricopeptide (TPR) repeat protein
MSRKPISESTLKRLFSLSGNKCAFPGCQTRLVDRDKNFLAQICHIEAAEPGGQRYNPNQTDDERRSYRNLIILCANHHKVTDDVVKYPTSRLAEMKLNHEENYLEDKFSVETPTLKQAQNNINKTYNIGSNSQIIAKKGNIIINVNQNDTRNPLNFLWNIFNLKLDGKIAENIKTQKNAENIKLYSLPESLKKINISAKLNIDQFGEETKKLLKKVSRKNSHEAHKTTTEILKERVKSPLDPKSRQTINKVISNLEKSSINDKEEINKLTTQNSKSLSKILNNLSLAKSNLELDEIEKIKNQGLALLEKQKSGILFSTGRAYLDLLMFRDAKNDLLLALSLDPENAMIVNEIFKLAIHIEDLDLSQKLAAKADTLITTTNNIDVLTDLYTNLGIYYFSSGEYDKSYNYYSELKRCFGFSSTIKNSQILETTFILTSILITKGEPQNAFNMIVSTLEKIIPNFKIDNPPEIHDDKIARLYNCISIVYATKNQFDKAYKYSYMFSKIMKNLSEISYTNPYLYTLSHINTSTIEIYRGNLNDAKRLTNQAKNYIQDNLGRDFSLMANAFANQGNILVLEGDARAAQREYSKAEEILSSNHTRSNLLKTAAIYCHQGNVYKMNADFSKSTNLYERALGILSNLFEPNSPNIVNLNYNLINPENSQNIILAF